MTAVFLFPLLWVIGLSLKTRLQVFAMPPLFVWWPTLENYVGVLGQADFLQAFVNSLVVSSGAVILSICVGVPAAYAFARFPFRGGSFLFFSLLVMRMLPPIAVLVPMYILFSKLGLTTTRLSVILAYSTFSLPLVVWIMRGFFEDLPRELEESAWVDGASRYAAFRHVVLPLIRPGLVAASILCAAACVERFPVLGRADQQRDAHAAGADGRVLRRRHRRRLGRHDRIRRAGDPAGADLLVRRATTSGCRAVVGCGEGMSSSQPKTFAASAAQPVWLDMDQAQLDDAYTQIKYAPTMPQILLRYASNSDLARDRLGAPRRIAYGPTPEEKLDLYPAAATHAPIAIYLHGGGWRTGAAEHYGFAAEMFVDAGAHYIAPDFVNVEATGGDLRPMVDQVRRAIAWVHRNAASFGGDPDRIHLYGHSSGAHLGGVAMVTDWAGRFGLPADVIKTGLLCGGMYDLRPVRLSARSRYVRFTDEIEQELSPQRHLELLHVAGCAGVRQRGDAGVPAPDTRFRRCLARRQPHGRVDRRSALQSFRNRRDAGIAVRGARPRRAGTDRRALRPDRVRRIACLD